MPAPVTSNRDPKRCTICGEEKRITEFYENRSERVVPNGVKLYAARCKACCVARTLKYQNDPSRRPNVLQYKRDHYQRWKAEGKANVGYEDRMYRRLYRSSLAAYDMQLMAQNSCCAICGRPPAAGEARFPFDHDHKTGYTRGVLCAACNGGLGCFRDDPERLKSALVYLRQWAELHAQTAANE